MIIGSKERFFPVTGFHRATLGVVRLVAEKDRPVGTGWLITDTLILDLVSSRSRESTLSCTHFFAPDNLVDVEKFYEFPESPKRLRLGDGRQVNTKVPVVLRLSESLPDCRPLDLAASRPAGGEQVILLQHLHGNPDLSFSTGAYHPLAEGKVIGYDADTVPGSGGAPILNTSMEVIGTHLGGHPPGLNYGLSIAAILDVLRESPAWGEIADYHKLVTLPYIDLSTSGVMLEASGQPSDSSFLRAAVLWNFDPGQFEESDRKQLQPLVGDPQKDRWSLLAKERRRLINSAGSLDALRAARGDDAINSIEQGVIDTILKGPPYDLDGIAEEALPYWLQAVRWFNEIVPSLPTPKEVNQTLERRRIRSRLRRYAGSEFRGRSDELARLKTWYDDEHAGPMTITGIGGIGKSALVSQFALTLPDDTVILWLDFDRADLAPDDAVSVLRVLSEQAGVQIDDFAAPALNEANWPQAAREFGAAFAGSLRQNAETAPLLVLDGFEIAQYVQKHQEIWELLGLILEQVPALRVLVSGRVPVPDLKLNGRAAESMHLTGLDRANVDAWLQDSGITDPDVASRVFELSKGVPLVLRLATQWFSTGGDLKELQKELPKVIVEGFLYQRILDRVMDEKLKEIAWDALVLRFITVDIIAGVLSDNLPDDLDAPEVFARLAREMSLVQSNVTSTPTSSALSMTIATDGSLRLRPEVRLATLRLLETERTDRVREIDKRAAKWYASHDLSDAVNVAELVYHRLRLSDLDGAEDAWRDDCIPHLMFAEDELQEDAVEARAWLREHLSSGSSEAAELEAWELDALGRIKNAMERQLLRAIPAILAERSERSPTSPLLVYDAWVMRQSGDLAGARKIMSTGAGIQGS